MNEYISSFTTGFGEVIRRALPLTLSGAEIVKVYDGLVHYRYGGSPADIEKIDFFNNTFFVMKKFEGGALDFPKMAGRVCGGPIKALYKNGTFRVRFSRENRFEGVGKQVSANVEQAVARQTRMKVDRVNPQNEFWFIIRSEGVGFFGELLHRPRRTEKTLQKGELRPEFAFLMGVYAGLTPPVGDKQLCDPFAGHGAIPIQLAERFGAEKMLVGDLDEECFTLLKNAKALQKPGINVCRGDALKMEHVSDHTVDLVVTDPPWGYYEQIEDIEGFYTGMLREFRRILKPDGHAVVLSARKAELTAAAESADVTITDRLDTLVNGKKAALFTLTF